MTSAIAPIITTLAEYQTEFWLLVAEELRSDGLLPHFISFDDRSSEMLIAADFPVVSANEIPPTTADQRKLVFDRVSLDRLMSWTAHERFAFNRNDDEAMHDKLARSILATEAAIANARIAGEPVVIQEVGGFLSVVGSYFAAQAVGVVNWFIEPSFFRGRMVLTKNSFAAPQFAAGMAAQGDAEFNAYLDETLEKGSIVIPEKDRHQYTSAVRKMFTARNARRLIEKSIDKYFHGKRQEFGFIGSHVGTHLRTIVNSHKLRYSYTHLSELKRFVYYPLHVPGDMALTVRSPAFLDQLALIDYLCRSLPSGVHLALKEHPAMVGMIDVKRMKQLLRRYPTLALLDPGTNNYTVMREAEAVVTVNSKSGAEAGLLGRPVIVLGDAFYRNAPFVTAAPRLSEVGSALKKVTDTYDEAKSLNLNRAETRNWFAALWEHTLPGELYVADKSSTAVFAKSLKSALT